MGLGQRVTNQRAIVTKLGQLIAGLTLALIISVSLMASSAGAEPNFYSQACRNRGAESARACQKSTSTTTDSSTTGSSTTSYNSDDYYANSVNQEPAAYEPIPFNESLADPIEYPDMPTSEAGVEPIAFTSDSNSRIAPTTQLLGAEYGVGITDANTLLMPSRYGWVILGYAWYWWLLIGSIAYVLGKGIMNLFNKRLMIAKTVIK
ncbi:hypothetical protein B7Y94_06160 [Candidatus Saccharibacteria bacterium 32-49-12]|nr:MAG: hypothetical protein B7Y94_06160 [Candidatus Saccharibacteria bacterium 32-49-12]